MGFCSTGEQYGDKSMGGEPSKPINRVISGRGVVGVVGGGKRDVPPLERASNNSDGLPGQGRLF